MRLLNFVLSTIICVFKKACGFKHIWFHLEELKKIYHTLISFGVKCSNIFKPTYKTYFNYSNISLQSFVPVKLFSGRFFKKNKPNKTCSVLNMLVFFFCKRSYTIVNNHISIFCLISCRDRTACTSFFCQLFYKFFSGFQHILKCTYINFMLYCSITHQSCYHRWNPFLILPYLDTYKVLLLLLT